MISDRIRIRGTEMVKCPSCSNTKVFRVQAEEVDSREWEYSVRCDICGTSWETGITESAFSPNFQKAHLTELIKKSMEEQ